MTIHPTNAFISFRTIYLFPVKETFRTNYEAIYYSKFNELFQLMGFLNFILF